MNRLADMQNVSLETIDLRLFVSHNCQINADETLETAYRVFRENDVSFLAVMDGGGRPLGMCSKHDVGMLLGHRFGNALYSHTVISRYLHSDAVQVYVGQPIAEVLSFISKRDEQSFYDDVMLMDVSGAFVGFIYVKDLIRLQTRFLTEKINQLEKTTATLNMQKEQMDQELLMSGKLQLAMLPHAAPNVVIQEETGNRPVDICSRMIPTGQVGGDFYYYFKTSDHSFTILVCDVMGHGVRSAMVTAILRAQMEGLQSLAVDPARVLHCLNAQVCQLFNRLDDVIFVTAICAHFDLQKSTICLSSAGHQSPVVMFPGGGACELVTQYDAFIGAALGFFDTSRYINYTTSTSPGEQYLFFTDGILEAQNKEGKEFDVRGLLDCVNQMADISMTEVLDHIVDTAKMFTCKSVFADDICMVGVKLPRVCVPMNSELNFPLKLSM